MGGKGLNKFDVKAYIFAIDITCARQIADRDAQYHLAAARIGFEFWHFDRVQIVVEPFLVHRLQRAVGFARLQESVEPGPQFGIVFVESDADRKGEDLVGQNTDLGIVFQHVFGGSVIGDCHVDFFTFYCQQQVGLGIEARNLGSRKPFAGKFVINEAADYADAFFGHVLNGCNPGWRRLLAATG